MNENRPKIFDMFLINMLCWRQNNTKNLQNKITLPTVTHVRPSARVLNRYTTETHVFMPKTLINSEILKFHQLALRNTRFAKIHAIIKLKREKNWK